MRFFVPPNIIQAHLLMRLPQGGVLNDDASTNAKVLPFLLMSDYAAYWQDSADSLPGLCSQVPRPGRAIRP